ncbi:hypothetical protein FAZ95_37325 [Trinickia violacea]|uniref:Uncharacterized protein n=1 Tax=Trinickia violacea TaxID=2571746 RepID=A0A4P8J3Q3_9BURK|nr:hypothetical protein [Trinickia violacea]QCP54544.1 hypothetical protein FAZ95_37325 [Trinickia violacea]
MMPIGTKVAPKSVFIGAESRAQAAILASPTTSQGLQMIDQIELHHFDDGSLGIGFLLPRTMIVVVPSVVSDLLAAVLHNVSSTSVSLEKIKNGSHKGRWDLIIFGNTFRMDECDVCALRSKLMKRYSH